ncbi:MAG: hypothetical protein JWR54_3585 [Mucilaginibacter sp.]|nr:hypothetical protein [Mucilaginibacter sp.]
MDMAWKTPMPELHYDYNESSGSNPISRLPVIH